MIDPPLSKHAAKLTAQVMSIAEGSLAPGETVIIAVRVNLPTTVAATAAGATGTATGALIGAEIASAGAADASGAGFPADAQQALGLTDRSLVITSRSSLSGKPNRLRQIIPLERISSIEHDDARQSSNLTITTTVGTRIEYSCVKRDPGAQLAAVLGHRSHIDGADD